MVNVQSAYALGGQAAAVTSLDEERFEDEVEAQWFTAKVDRKRLKSLMKRSDAAGYRHFGAWLVLLIASLVGISPPGSAGPPCRSWRSMA